MGRQINQDRSIDPVIVTTISVGIGAFFLLVIGPSSQGIPQITYQGWLAILWMAIVNTAFAFYLWNVVLRSLPAFKASVINSATMIQIAFLSFLFLGKSFTPIETIGLILVAVINAEIGSEKHNNEVNY